MFIKAELPDRNTNPSGDDFWYSDIGGPTDSGVRVSSLSAMQCAIFYACDRMLAETLAQLPLFVYKRLPDGRGRDKAIHADIYPLLHDQPNEHMTSYTFRALMQHWVNVRGNGYAEIIFAPNGRVDSLIPRHPDLITIQYMDDESVRYIYTDPFTHKQRTILSHSMFHTKGYSEDGLVGLNPVHVQRNSIGSNIAGRAYDARFFKNDGQTPGIVSMEGTFEESEDRKNWLKDWNKRHRNQRQHSIELLEHGMSYQSTGMSYIDAQFLEMMRYRDEDIARIMKVQQHKVGIMTKSSFSNIEEQNLEFVGTTMLPIAVNWEQEGKRSLIIDDDIFMEFLLEGLLRGNITAQTNANTKNVFAGIVNRNEVRQQMNLNPADGLDEYLEPQNTRSANDDGDGGNSNNNNSNNSAAVPSDREQRLAMKAAARVVNKSVVATRKAYKKYMTDPDSPDLKSMEAWTREFYSDHGEFVSDCLVADKKTGERIATGSMNATIGAIVAEAHGHDGLVESLMAEWESDRAQQLANVGVFNNG